MATFPHASFLMVAASISGSPACFHPSIVIRSLTETILTTSSPSRAENRAVVPSSNCKLSTSPLPFLWKEATIPVTVAVFSPSRPVLASFRGGGGRSSSAIAGPSCGSGGPAWAHPPASKASQQITHVAGKTCRISLLLMFGTHETAGGNARPCPVCSLILATATLTEDEDEENSTKMCS